MNSEKPPRAGGVGRISIRGNPGVLGVDDLRDVAERFGVSEAQVRRDHAISHVLWAISNQMPDAVIFFGGTTSAQPGRLRSANPGTAAVTATHNHVVMPLL